MKVSTVCILAKDHNHTGSTATPSCLSSVGGQVLISQLIAKFDSNSKFIFAARSGLKQISDYILSSHPNLNTQFVQITEDEDCSAESNFLEQIRPQLNDSFYLANCDFLWSENVNLRDEKNNWMGICDISSVSNLSNPILQTSDNKISSFNPDYAIPARTAKAFAGVMFVKSPVIFFYETDNNIALNDIDLFESGVHRLIEEGLLYKKENLVGDTGLEPMTSTL